MGSCRINHVLHPTRSQKEVTAWPADWLFSCNYTEYLLSTSHFSVNVSWWKLSGAQEDFGIHKMKNVQLFEQNSKRNVL